MSSGRYARTRRAIRALPGLALAAALSTPAHGDGWAEQITRENAARLRVGGPDAVGGVGDWALGNGVLCAVVSDPSHESHLTPQGGVLIDLARCGLSHDTWNTVEGLLNMSRDRMLGASWIRAEPDRADGSVAIVTGSRVEGLELETTYRLAPDRPDVLEIATRATRREEEADVARAFLFGWVVLHGRRQLAPFTLHLAEGDSGVRQVGSVGFVHPDVDPDDTLTMVRAILPSDLHVLVGGDRQRPGVAYGLKLREAFLVSPDGSRQPLPALSLNGESFTMQAVFTRPLRFGGQSGIGWLELAQTLLMDLSPGEGLEITREIRVGARSDVASVTDQLWRDSPRVRGRVEPGARVHVFTRDEVPVTQARPDAEGRFAFHLPRGSYRLRVVGAADRQRSTSFEVGADGVELGELSLPPTGKVLLPRGRPMRLLFLRADGRKATFGDDHLGFRIGRHAFRGSQYGADVSLGGIDEDPRWLPLAPGRYEVIATRGPEFDLTRTAFDLKAGAEQAIRIDPPARVLSHPGWISADLHVHSEWSDDGNYPVDRQLAAFAAEGADWIVATEHDRVTDYAPRLKELGLSGSIQSLVGAEVTSSAHAGESPRSAGHSNVYPLPFDPLAYRGGAPVIEGRRLRDLIGDLRQHPEAPLVQLNHPRGRQPGDSDLNYFDHLSVVSRAFQPEATLDTWPNAVLVEPDPESGLRDLDFDLIELWNGASMSQYRAVRADWYSLLLQGEFRTGVANSDSHDRSELIAYPRTYLRIDGEADEQSLVAALRAGRAYGSSGPLLDVSLVADDGRVSRLGDLHAGSDARLRVQVRAAPWVPVSRLRVYVNGRVAHRAEVTPGEPVTLPLRFPRDAFVTVEVRGDATGDYAKVAPGFEPFAFSNPIFVDADGDGRFTAPGLPAGPLPVLDRHWLD